MPTSSKTYFVEESTTNGMKINGTQAWGQVWDVFSSESGTRGDIDNLFVGFFTSKEDAENIKALLSKI